MPRTAVADVELTWDQVLAWRLARHGLGERVNASDVPSDPVGLVGHLAGVQAQVAAVGRPGPGRPRGRPGRPRPPAVERRTLVKTWAMRGTLHLLARGRVAHLGGGATHPRVAHHARAGCSTTASPRHELDAVTEAIPEALAGEPLDPRRAGDRVAAITGLAHLGEQLRSGWAAVFKPAASRGLLARARRRAPASPSPTRAGGWRRGAARRRAVRSTQTRRGDGHGPRAVPRRSRAGRPATTWRAGWA